MTLQELQTQTDQWIKEYGVRYFDEKTNTILLMEEMGEFARLVSRIYGEQSFKEPFSKDEAQTMLADELADILFVMTCLANQMHIDLAAAMQKNIEKKTQRDKHRHNNNPKLNL